MNYLITDSVDIYRLEKTGNTKAYGVAAVYTRVECGIFPAGTDILAVYPSIDAFQLHEVFIHEDVDLKNGDKLITQGNKEYIVQGVPQKFDTRYLFFTRVVGQLVV